mmetsp:Transcript_24180/g.78818  ORF Transcript_24180/g.78818 Transcript_24180/m.78818 type:complete len:497 (-) Transcript_24180:92-1582(-)
MGLPFILCFLADLVLLGRPFFFSTRMNSKVDSLSEIIDTVFWQAYFFSVFILMLILLSCTSFVLETIPILCCGRYDSVWNNIEVVCVSAFTFEYLSRLLVVPTFMNNEGRLASSERTGPTAEILARLRFLFRPLNAIDLTAILPYYIQLMLPNGNGASGTSFLRIIRLARVFRLFKLSKYSEGMWLLSATLMRSWRALSMLLFFMLISVILFSSVMYYVERGDFFYCTMDAARQNLCRIEDVVTFDPTVGQGLEQCRQMVQDALGISLDCCDGQAWYAWPPLDQNGDGCIDKSKFESILLTAWWCVVTMTTVGYGDVVPVTAGGQLIAVLTMLSGILLLALPITVIGSNFNIEYERSEAEQRMHEQLEWAEKSKSQKVTPLEEREASVPQDEIIATPSSNLPGNGSMATPTPMKQRRSLMSSSWREESRPGADSNSAGTQRILLATVERLMAEHREMILRKADEMIKEHVKEIAREVVARNREKKHGTGNGTDPTS